MLLHSADWRVGGIGVCIGGASGLPEVATKAPEDDAGHEDAHPLDGGEDGLPARDGDDLCRIPGQSARVDGVAGEDGFEAGDARVGAGVGGGGGAPGKGEDEGDGGEGGVQMGVV